MVARSWASERQGEYQAAIAEITAALKLRPSLSWAWKRLEFCSRKVQDPADFAALDELHQHMKKDPKALSSRAESLAEIYLIRAKLFANEGDTEKAIADSQTA